MRQKAIGQALRALERVARKKNIGTALCPHCKKYQNWMVRKSRLNRMGCGAILGPLVFAGIPLVIGLVNDRLEKYMLLVVAGLILGVVVGAVTGGFTGLKTGPHPDKEDPRAMTDEDLLAFLADCEARDHEPTLRWLFETGYQHNEQNLLVPLGFRDLAAEALIPAELTTEYVVQRL